MAEGYYGAATPSPAYGTPSPSYGTPSPGYGTPSPSYYDQYYNQQGESPILPDGTSTDMSTGTTTGEEGEVSQNRRWAVLCGFLMLLGSMLIIVLLVFYSLRDTEIQEEPAPVERGGGGGGGGGGGAPESMVVPSPPTPRPAPPIPRITFTPRPTPPPTTTPTTTTTTTTPPPPLLCSVGTQAAIAPLFPPDRSCDIVIYTHVRVLNRAVVGSVNDISYAAFKNACKDYRETTCGYSFDSGYIEKDMFQTVEIRDYLSAAMTLNRVRHYGILNIFNTHDVVASMTTTIAPAMLKVMRNLLGNDRRRNMVFVGVGFYFYNDTNAWHDLEYVAESISLPEVDVVVVLSTVLTMPQTSQCFTIPINAYRSRNTVTPTMDGASSMAVDSFARPSLIVAFSLQMGVVFYRLISMPDTASAGLYQDCKVFGVTDYSQACQAPQTDLNLEKTAIGLSSNDQYQRVQDYFLLAFDTLDHMIDKATLVMEKSNTRQNLTWMLLNADKTDSTRKCLSGGPFERITGFRDFYYRQAQKPKG